MGGEGEKSTQYIINFLGLNMGEGAQNGEMTDCENLSSALYPVLSQRTDRTLVGNYISPDAIINKDGLFVIDGTRAIYKGTTVGEVAAGRKQLAVIGDIIVIFPDKKYYNVDTNAFGSLEETYTAAAGTITFANTTTEATITTSGEAFNFRVGDAIEISGCTSFPENNKSAIVRGVDGKILTFYANTFTAGKEESAVTITRKVPDLDFICESNYRLWGTMGNTIYASKYGDPFNFYNYDGLTGDSYSIDVGSNGEFTGCIPYSSHICFFKEDVMHKIYGSKPSNFQVVEAQVYGVQAGCERSLKIVNETLFYKGRNGVYAYTGSVPELISSKFGVKRFADAVAESDGERYYISMRSGDEWGLYVFDISRALWLKEDNTHAVDMTVDNGRVVYLDEAGSLYRMEDARTDKEIEWSATFGKFTETVNERKGYSKFHARLDLEDNAWLQIEMNIDGKGWRRIYTTHNDRKRTISVPIIPTRCDNIQLRISGKGRCMLRSLVRDFTIGSEV